jgi:hypothetical protein
MSDDVLSMPLHELLSPPELRIGAGTPPGSHVRVLEAHLVRAIQLDSGVSWIEAHERFHDGIKAAYGSGNPTVKTALEHALADPEYVAGAVKLLEQRDAAVERAYDRAIKRSKLETDDRGLVLLDQGDGLDAKTATADVGKALTDAAERETRYLRALNAGRLLGDPKYRYDAQGEQGRAIFDAEDRLHLQAGTDLVRTLELAVENLGNHREAEQTAQQTAYRLDQAIEKAGTDRAELKALEQQLSEMDRSTDSVDFETALAQLRARANGTTTKPLRMLDQLAVIDKKKGRKKRHEQTLTLLDQATGDAAAPATAESAIAKGVHPGSHLLDQRVRARMAALDAPASAYSRVLDQILAEEG